MSDVVRVAMFAAEKTLIEITTSDTVSFCQLLADATGDLEKEEGLLGPGSWTVTLEAGVIYGLLSEDVRFREDLATVIYADGKDPWPPPPPPPPYQAMKLADFEDRFVRFRIAAAGGPPTPPVIERQDKVIRIRPRRPTVGRS